MTAPEPRDVDEALAGIVRRLRGLADQYRWLHPTAYSSPSQGIVPGHTHNAADLSDTLVTTQRVRRDVGNAGRLILAAEKNLAQAWHALMTAQAQVEGDRPDKPDPVAERTLERPATKREIKLARQARVRRAERGEGWGVG